MTVIPLRPRRGQGTDPPKTRPRGTLSLTDVETMRLRAALKNLRGLFGSWGCLAEAMGVNETTVTLFVSDRRLGGSPGMALAASRAAGVSVEALLGDLKVAASCPHCGAAWEVRS